MKQDFITDYYVAEGFNPDELEKDVLEHIERYAAQPYGSMSVAQINDPGEPYSCRFYQPMVVRGIRSE